MNIFPTKNQWQDWSLPSKITYISFVLAISSIFITLITFYFSNKYAKESDQPKLSINLTNKPYLRYEVKDKGIELSYELRITNDGKNTAEDITYSLLKQKLAVDMMVVVEVNSSLNTRAPQRLITQNTYHQIIKAKSNDMSASQIERVINDYDSEKLAVVLEIKIEYRDSITLKKYSTKETLRIYKTRVEIL